MIQVDQRDLVGGLVVALVGGAFFIGSRGLPEGPPGQIGPAFVPGAVGLIAVAIGVLIAARAFRAAVLFPRIEPRPVLAIFGAVAAFGLLVTSAGLVPALLATSVIAAAGSVKSRPRSVALLALAVAAGCWLIFVVALGLPVAAFRVPF